MKTNQAGISIIKKFEQCRLFSYQCSAGVWTIGWGHTGPNVKSDMQISQQLADMLLEKDLERFEKDVKGLVKIPINENQFSALVSFAFNVGSDIDADEIAEGLGDSTLLKKLNAGDVLGAAEEFQKWNRCKGKVLNGLTKRRLEEKELFLS